MLTISPPCSVFGTVAPASLTALQSSGVLGKSGTGGTISDVHVISVVWLVMIGDFQSRGDFPSVPRHPPAPTLTQTAEITILLSHNGEEQGRVRKLT